MATNKLAIYNVACLALGERPLDSLTDDVEIRHLLDHVYDRGDGVIRATLEQGHWNFGMRAVKIDKDSSVTPEFGFSNAFSIPLDFVRLNMISAGETFGRVLTRYEIEGAYIFADIDPIYLRYVSDDIEWGADLSLWPETFFKFVGYHLAGEVAPSLTNDIDMEALTRRITRVRRDARSKDASQEPVRFPPLSSWSTARFGRYSGRRDRGSRNSLTG